jgi:hypothetical protein
MIGLRESAADISHGAAVVSPLASWYTQGISDGVGDRLLMSDNTSNASLELLRFRRELALAPGFERILRGTVARLSRFNHPAFSRVRAVEHLESDGGLALVSTHVPGRRLSELFRAGERVAGVPPAFVAWLIRWLTPAIAELRRGTGVAHGTITPDRIVLAPDGRPVLVEPVLGRPMEALGLSPDALWNHFGMVVPPVTFGTPQFDDRSDIYQLGWVCLSLLLGRRLAPADLADDLQGLLDEFGTSPDGRKSSFTPALTLWLDRALRTDGGGFRSAQEAWDGSRQLSHAPRPDMARLAGGGVDAAGEAASPLAGAIDRAHALWTREGLRRVFTARRLIAGLAGMVVLQAIIIGFLVSGRAAPPARAAGPVRNETTHPGDVVVVDGQEIGVTPLELTVGDSARIISIVPAPPSIAEARPRAVAPRPTSEASAPNRTAAAARPQTVTGLRLVSPIELNVFEDARAVGSSARGTITLPAGVHQLEFVNEALGYRSSQRVEIRSGEVSTITIQPPGGRVSINAMPWAQVWINGKPVGETPIAFLPIAAGEHEIVFRHPDLGERRERLVVRSGADTRVSTTFGQ